MPRSRMRASSVASTIRWWTKQASLCCRAIWSCTRRTQSTLNASPEAAAIVCLALIRTVDRVRIDLNQGRADILIDEAELQRRRAELEAAGGFAFPASQTPWQEIQRALVGQMD